MPGILLHPVMSPATADLWSDTGAAITRDSLDTCVIGDSYQDHLYLWTIDKSNWTIVGLHVYGPLWNYQGAFVYGDFEGTPYLREVVDTRGTSIYVFRNIRVNGVDLSPVRAPVVSRTAEPGLALRVVAGGAAQLSLPDAGGMDQGIFLLDVAGRAVGSWNVAPEIRRFSLPLAGARGPLLVRWQAGTRSESAIIP